jgi:hypothetical protein
MPFKLRLLGEVAVIVVTPIPTAIACPVARLTVATFVADEVQMTEAVTSCVLLSLNVARAMNCCRAPSGIEVLAGLTVIERRTLATVNVRP